MIVAVSLALIAWRGDRLRSPGAIDSAVSREGAFLANNAIFALFAFVVLLGTVFPLIVEAKPSIDEPFLRDASTALWQLPEREHHYAAMMLLDRHKTKLTPVSISLLRELIQKNSWWDSVDALASHCVGTLVLRHPRLQGEMDAWSEDEDFWIRRCAIIHQIHSKEKTDAGRLFRYCVANAAGKEFLIRKAIGWALRQYAYTDAKAVVEFVAEHPELSNLSKREALKHC